MYLENLCFWLRLLNPGNGSQIRIRYPANIQLFIIIYNQGV